MQEKRKNEDETRCSKRGRKSDDKKSLWADLPSIAVEKIYAYLNRKDQSRMSMVCRNWNREIGSPSLWRKFEFLVPEQHLNLRVYPEVRFARKYGHFFHHIAIVWNVPVQRSHVERVWKQVKLFLEALAFHSTSLETVKFLHMINHSLRFYGIHGDVHQTLKNFFLSQHQLKTVEIRGADFLESAEAELLRVIFLKNSKSLQNVTLVNNVIAIPDEDGDGDVVNEAIFASLLNMKTLRLDYNRFFENIMIAFHEYIQNSDSRRTRGNLELFEIIVGYDLDDTYRGIPPEFWKLLTKLNPSLRINLTLKIAEFEGDMRDVIDLFVRPTIPLKVLTINVYPAMSVGYDAETKIGLLFRYLQSCVSNEFLEDLSIVWASDCIDTIDLTGFLQRFQKLRNLDISTEVVEAGETLSRTLFITDRNVRVTCRSSVWVHLITDGETRN